MISKKAAQKHLEAIHLAQTKRDLSPEERMFVLEHFDEGAQHLNRIAGAFFTPMDVSHNLTVEIDTGDTVIDLCAGTGRLVHAFAHRMKRVVCVEANPDYVAIGKKVVPEAEWILGDVFDVIRSFRQSRTRFNIAVSNPPFGRLSTPGYNGHLSTASFEHKLMEAAGDVARCGIFIVPQGSAGWLSKRTGSTVRNSAAAIEKFETETGLSMQSMSMDMSVFETQWNGTVPKVEMVYLDYSSKRGQMSLVA